MRAGGNALGWEFVTITFPRNTSRSGAREYVVGQAAAGQWVLDRMRVYPDGTRRVRLRRRAMRVARTV